MSKRARTELAAAHVSVRPHQAYKCVECGATKTPQWREGPLGPKTLCNACGVRHLRSVKKRAEAGIAPQVAHQAHAAPNTTKQLPQRPTSLRRAAKSRYATTVPADAAGVSGHTSSSELSAGAVVDGDDEDRRAAQELLEFASLAASEDGVEEQLLMLQEHAPPAQPGRRVRRRTGPHHGAAQTRDFPYLSEQLGGAAGAEEARLCLLATEQPMAQPTAIVMPIKPLVIDALDVAPLHGAEMQAGAAAMAADGGQLPGSSAQVEMIPGHSSCSTHLSARQLEPISPRDGELTQVQSAMLQQQITTVPSMPPQQQAWHLLHALLQQQQAQTGASAAASVAGSSTYASAYKSAPTQGAGAVSSTAADIPAIAAAATAAAAAGGSRHDVLQSINSAAAASVQPGLLCSSLGRLSPAQQQQLGRLQQSLAEAQLKLAQAEQEQQETFALLVRLQAEAQLARLKVEQQTQQLQQELMALVQLLGKQATAATQAQAQAQAQAWANPQGAQALNQDHAR